MAKIEGEMNLFVQKIQMECINDWGAVELDNIDPGLYLCENSDGGMFLMAKDGGGNRFGFWLPVAEIGNIYVKAAEEKVVEQIKQRIESGLKLIENTTNESYCVLNDLDDNLNAKISMFEEGLTAIRKQIDELPKHLEQQKSTFAEMSDAVVNIITATK